MRSRVGGAIGAALLLVLSACGDRSEGGKPAPDTMPSAAAAPSPDPTTKAEAQKALDQAYDRFIEASTARYRSTVEIYGSKLVAEGHVDVERTRGDWRLVQPDLGRDGAENGEFAMRGIAIDRHVYGGPEFGPGKKCWFDYGVDNVAAIQGLAPTEDPIPWFSAARVVVTEARALGFVDGRRDVIAVEVFADTALSVNFNKVLLKVYDQLPEKQVWSPATLTLKDGQFSELTFRPGDALDALEAGGVDFASVPGADQLADFMISATQTAVYDQFGVPVQIEAPPADQLVDASGITADTPNRKLRPCAAAR